jgi:PHD-finger
MALQIHGRQKKKEELISDILGNLRAMDGEVDAPAEIYCVCRQPEIPGVLMLQCDQCEEWFHGPCVGYPDESKVSGLDSYTCDSCGGSPTTERTLRLSPGAIVEGPNGTIGTVQRGRLTSIGEEQYEVSPVGTGAKTTTFSASELRVLDSESIFHSSEDELSFNSHSSGDEALDDVAEDTPAPQSQPQSPVPNSNIASSGNQLALMIPQSAVVAVETKRESSGASKMREPRPDDSAMSTLAGLLGLPETVEPDWGDNTLLIVKHVAMTIQREGSAKMSSRLSEAVAMLAKQGVQTKQAILSVILAEFLLVRQALAPQNWSPEADIMLLGSRSLFRESVRDATRAALRKACRIDTQFCMDVFGSADEKASLRSKAVLLITRLDSLLFRGAMQLSLRKRVSDAACRTFRLSVNVAAPGMIRVSEVQESASLQSIREPPETRAAVVEDWVAAADRCVQSPVLMSQNPLPVQPLTVSKDELETMAQQAVQQTAPSAFGSYPWSRVMMNYLILVDVCTRRVEDQQASLAETRSRLDEAANAYWVPVLPQAHRGKIPVIQEIVRIVKAESTEAKSSGAQSALALVPSGPPSVVGDGKKEREDPAGTRESKPVAESAQASPANDIGATETTPSSGIPDKEVVLPRRNFTPDEDRILLEAGPLPYKGWESVSQKYGLNRTAAVLRGRYQLLLQKRSVAAASRGPIVVAQQRTPSIDSGASASSFAGPESTAIVEFDLDGARIFPPFDLESMGEADCVLQAWSDVQALSANDRSLLKALAALSSVDTGVPVDLSWASPAVKEVFDRLSSVLRTPKLIDQVLAATSRTMLQALVGFGESREIRRQARLRPQPASPREETAVVETPTAPVIDESVWEPLPDSSADSLKARDAQLRDEYRTIRATFDSSLRDLAARRSAMFDEVPIAGLWKGAESSKTD